MGAWRLLELMHTLVTHTDCQAQRGACPEYFIWGGGEDDLEAIHKITFDFKNHVIKTGACGGEVVKALRYKPVDRGFYSRWCNWNFSVTYSYRSHYGLGVDSSSNRNE